MNRFPSKKKLEERLIIGIDEFNNGKSHPEVPFICVAYTSFPSHKLKGKIISKGRGFKDDSKVRSRFRKNALEFLREHSRFDYFSLEASADQIFSSATRATATARLIYESAIKHIHEDPLIIIDGAPFSPLAEEIIEETLERYGLPLEDVFFRKKADVIYDPVKTADRIAYCLGALRYGSIGSQRKWPYRNRKIDFRAEPPTEEDYLLYGLNKPSMQR